MPEEKSTDQSRSSPPRAPFTEFEVALLLDRMSRDIKQIKDDLETARKNDERYSKMEHDFRIVRWFAVVAATGAIAALVAAVASRVSWRSDAAPAPSSTADRMGADRVPSPTPSLHAP